MTVEQWRSIKVADQVRTDLKDLKRIFGYENMSKVIRRALCASGYNREFIDRKLKMLNEQIKGVSE